MAAAAAAATSPPRPASQLPRSTSAALSGSWHRRSLHQLPPPHTLPLRNPFMPSTAVVDAPNPPLLTAAASTPAAALASTAPPLITVAEPPPPSHGAATLDGTFVTRAIRVRAASAATRVGTKGGGLLPDSRRRKRAGEGGRLYHLADPAIAATPDSAKHLAVLVGGGAPDRRPPAAQRRRLHSASAESAAAAAAAAVAAAGDVVTVP
eukprot:Rhum_TRINITY_DN16144_c0_g1::Rhum_TRINITY_DN16144_c0_g1_i1::g.162819::m.162819